MSRKSRKQKLLQPTRRQALSMLGGCGLAPFFFDPAKALIAGMVDGLIMSAQAQSNPGAATPRNYVYVNLSGGPARWVWDLPLSPYQAPSSANLVPNRHVATRFSATPGQLEYATTPITRAGTTLHMPWLWRNTIPTVVPSGAGWALGAPVPMAGLLDHMLMIRGVNMLADGHPDNNRKQLRPLVSMHSLHGAVADGAPTPLPAVEVDGAPGAAYKSNKGIGQTRVTDGVNPLRAILSPFNRGTELDAGGYRSRRDLMETAVNQALASLGAYAGSSLPGSADLFNLRSRAEQQLKAGIGDVAAIFPRLQAKYRMLFLGCADWINNASRMEGLSDRAIPTSSFGSTPLALRYMQRGDALSGADLRGVIDSSTIAAGLVDGFAVAEYLITQGFSTSVIFGSGRMTSCGMMSGTGGNWSFDEHYQGAVGSLLVNSYLFRGLSACLHEFISTLGPAKFNETVIQVGSEFSRRPDDGMGDSDHGWQANCTSLFSGVIDRPLVLGNQKLDFDPGGRNRGTWGASASIRVDGSTGHLGIGHSTSTVAQLLRVAPPVSNNASLVDVNPSGSGVSSRVETATTKDEE